MSAPTLVNDVGRPVSAPRRRPRRILLLVLAVLVAIGAGWVVWASPVLAVKSVRVVDVTGAGLTDEAQGEVLRAAAIPAGIPLARLDADAAQVAVAVLPWVAGVEVRRGWPSEVVLAVATRQPAARTPDGRAVSADGVVFDSVVPIGKAVPVVDATGDGLGAAVAVLASLPGDLSRRVVTARATSLDDVALTLRSGDLVRWGSVEDADLKASVLAALMKRKASVYDVSAPRLPTTYTSP